MDVQLTKDNEVIVFHDSNLMRLTGLNQEISNLNLNNLIKIKLLNSNDCIPSFAEVLHVINSQVPIIVELKDSKKQNLRVATKYQNLTRDFLFSKGVTQFKLINSLGATETYPFTGSSEIITDITSTGETLMANDLRVLKDGIILESQACLLVSKTSKKKAARSGLLNSFV